jgi:hypothetical protein
MSQAQPLGKKKGQYSCRLFGANNLKERAVQHIDPLLGNDRETNNWAKAHKLQQRNGFFCAVRAKMLQTGQLVRSQSVSWLVSD